MIEKFDAKQERINVCGSGLVLVMTNEKEVTDKETRQTGEETTEEVEVTRYEYEVTEVEGVKAPYTDKEVLAALKAKRVSEIEAYDVSDKVNAFTLIKDGVKYPYWLPAAKRNQLVGSVTTWSESHEKYTLDLREYGKSVEIECNRLLEVLSALEEYAVKCFNTTTSHLNAINQAETIEGVINYDYTAGYPEQLTFEV